MTDERTRITAELRRIRDEVRQRALLEPEAKGARPSAPEVRAPEGVPREEAEAQGAPPARPDATEVNRLWQGEPEAPRRGPRGLLARLLWSILRERGEAQRAFNARQVQLDNDLLAYIDARFDATHTHYDRVLGQYGRHLGEADERHLILQEELVAHVHDLVKRIDLVLSEAERGRLSLEFALKDIRERLVTLEARLSRE
jgi:hypothetical protein